jgi:alkylation response protein AidB-like acyl-CoA dehydrogenase
VTKRGGLPSAPDLLLKEEGGRPDYLARARELAPLVAAAADEIEQSRRIPRALLDRLIRAGLFRLLLPRDYGGAEVEPLTFVKVMRTVAGVDASTAWCLCQLCGCSMVAAYMRPDAAREVYAGERQLVAWGPPAGAQAIATDGGYRLTGTWHFASGGRHATWLGGICTLCEQDGTPRLKPDGSPEERTILFPAAEAEMRDVWHVIGLRGTGSDSYAVTDLFVPEVRCVARDDPALVVHHGILYQFPIRAMFSVGFAGVALGTARAALEALLELARNKKPRGFKAELRQDAIVQFQVAQADARLRAGECLLYDTLEQVWQAAQAQGCLSIEHRVRIRQAASHAIKEAREAVAQIYLLAGSSSIFTESAIERRFRDMNAIGQQLQGRQDHFQNVGMFLLGIEPDLQFM